MIGFLLGAVRRRRRLSRLAERFPTLDRLHAARVDVRHHLFHRRYDGRRPRQSACRSAGCLFLAAATPQRSGLLLGYWLSRALGWTGTSARTVAFEVGLQNGGMASGIAGAMGKLGTVGLAAAVFSPWMNVSGSILANYWRKRPIELKRLDVGCRQPAAEHRQPG